MTTHTTRNSLPSLWEQAVQLWRDLVNSFGGSALMIRWGVMRALEHRALGHWLRDLEKIVRRAIRDDAEDLDLPPQKPRAKRPKPRPLASREARPRPTYAGDPSTWKVTFRMSTREYDPTRKRYPRKTPRNYDPEVRRPCIGYALRIEALRCAIRRRRDYILRYARRLARMEQARVEALHETLSQYFHAKSWHYISGEDWEQQDPPPDPTLRSAGHVEPG